jgi:hypothetical protein
MLLQVGSWSVTGQEPSPEIDHARRNLEIACLATDDLGDEQILDPMPQEVLACNFWLLACEAGHESAPLALYRSDGMPNPLAEKIQQWVAGWQSDRRPRPEWLQEQKEDLTSFTSPTGVSDKFPIGHYVLLPLYAWGASGLDLNRIQSLFQDSHPTLGFSLAEARLAARVTVIGDDQAYSRDALQMLRSTGCFVERMLEDGTLFATQ